MAIYTIDKKWYKILNIWEKQESLQAVVTNAPRSNTGSPGLVSYVTDYTHPPTIPQRLVMINGFLSGNNQDWNGLDYKGNPIKKGTKDTIQCTTQYLTVLPLQIAPDGKWWSTGVIKEDWQYPHVMRVSYEDSPWGEHSKNRTDIIVDATGVNQIKSYQLIELQGWNSRREDLAALEDGSLTFDGDSVEALSNDAS